MANGKILRQLFKAGTLGDQAAFRRASEAIIEEERQKQHHLLANDLEQILYGGDMHVQSARKPQFTADIPVIRSVDFRFSILGRPSDRLKRSSSLRAVPS